MITLVLDMMGGDLGSSATCAGALDFLSENNDCKLICVGKIEETDSLKENKNITLIDARDIVPMEAGVLEVMRLKDSSMMKAIDTLINEHADGIVSCGGTGAYLSATTLKLKKIPGVIRPALVSPFPSKIQGKQVVILDIGASNENSKEELAQFALMGKLYAQNVFNNVSPNVYLLSNGTEEGKGSPLVKETYELLKDKDYFKGNIEAREALNGSADVIVCDGFTGNIFLKACEGIAKMMSGMIKEAFKKNVSTKIGYVFAKKGFDEMKTKMDYKSTGGAMLLGINSAVVKAHGSSDAYSFKCALRVAYKLAKNDLVNKMRDGFKENA